MSQRLACGLLGVPRSTLSYPLRMRGKVAPVLAAMERLSAQYPRYCYRRIRIFLRQDGFHGRQSSPPAMAASGARVAADASAPAVGGKPAATPAAARR